PRAVCEIRATNVGILRQSCRGDIWRAADSYWGGGTRRAHRYGLPRARQAAGRPALAPVLLASLYRSVSLALPDRPVDGKGYYCRQSAHHGGHRLLGQAVVTKNLRDLGDFGFR